MSALLLNALFFIGDDASLVGPDADKAALLQGISEKENRIKVWEVQQRLVPPPPDLVKPHRIFVREGSWQHQSLLVGAAWPFARHYFLLVGECLIFFVYCTRIACMRIAHGADVHMHVL